MYSNLNHSFSALGISLGKLQENQVFWYQYFKYTMASLTVIRIPTLIIRVYIHKYKKPLLKINSSFEKVEWVKYRHSYLHGIRYIITTIKPTYPEESICLIWYTIFQSATECYVDLLLSASNSYLWLLQFLQYQNKRLKIQR